MSDVKPAADLSIWASSHSGEGQIAREHHDSGNTLENPAGSTNPEKPVLAQNGTAQNLQSAIAPAAGKSLAHPSQQTAVPAHLSNKNIPDRSQASQLQTRMTPTQPHSHSGSPAVEPLSIEFPAQLEPLSTDIAAQLACVGVELAAAVPEGNKTQQTIRIDEPAVMGASSMISKLKAPKSGQTLKAALKGILCSLSETVNLRIFK